MASEDGLTTTSFAHDVFVAHLARPQLLDARLTCGVEDVVGPRVVIAVGVVIHQICRIITLGRVAFDIVPG